MSFTDWRFLLFFPIVFGLNFLLPLRYRWILLLGASYWFYMSWRPEYGLLLFLITAIDFVSGWMMGRVARPQSRIGWLLFSLSCNLGILFYFKYFNFFVGSAQSVLSSFGTGASLPVLDILLPIGISFHVFQSLSYVIDVYMKRVEPVSHFGKFALFVSFFPQLVAGPIERPSGLLREFFEDRPFKLDLARLGAKRMAWGYFKKLVIADRIAPMVTAVFVAPTDFPGPSLFLATILFSYQIYCDFSGYTDIARGSANILGYELMKNFDAPYSAKSVGEFWRRWHISLSTWFRDYVYIPLGGSRVGDWRKAFNIMATFMLSGLWHGANWTYVIWGGLNGFYLVLSDWTKVWREKAAASVFQGPLARTRPFFQVVTTFLLISFAWIFFRAPDVSTALYIVTHLFSNLGGFAQSLLSSEGVSRILFLGAGRENFLIVVCGIVLLELIQKAIRDDHVEHRMIRIPRVLRLAGYSAFAALILLLGNFVNSPQFIYFQF